MISVICVFHIYPHFFITGFYQLDYDVVFFVCIYPVLCYWGSWIYGFIVSIWFGKIWPLFLQMFFLPSTFFWNSSDCLIWFIRSLMFCSLFSRLFSLSLDPLVRTVTFVIFFLSSLIFSSTVSNLQWNFLFKVLYFSPLQFTFSFYFSIFFCLYSFHVFFCQLVPSSLLHLDLFLWSNCFSPECSLMCNNSWLDAEHLEYNVKCLDFVVFIYRVYNLSWLAVKFHVDPLNS